MGNLRRMEYPDCFARSPFTLARLPLTGYQDSPVPPVVIPRRLEELTAMLHFSCDICGKDLTAEGAARFVVKMEAFAATDPALLTDDDLAAIYTYLRSLKPVVNRVKKFN